MTERGPDGKFLPGNKASAGNKGGGRPTSEAAERLHATLEEIVSNGTLPKWKAAMKKKLERGDPWATEFVFNRMLGKVPNESTVDVTTNGESVNGGWTHAEVIAAIAAASTGSISDSSE